MSESYSNNFTYNDYLNSKIFNIEDKQYLSDVLKNQGKKISDIIFRDNHVLDLVKKMPKKRKTSLLDFDTSKPFSEMSLKIISSENLVSLKQIYGDDFFNKLIKGKTYITFDNIGFSPLVLMALYAQHYSLTFSNRFLRG